MPITNKEPPTHIKSESVAFVLVVRNSVSEDFIVTYAVLVYPTAITGVSLNGINDTVLDLLDNTSVVGLSILRTRRTLVIPIKENNHSGDRLGRTVDPLSTIFEPLDAVHAACIFGYNPGVNIAALIGTPAHEAGTPFHTASEAIPRPIRLAAHIAHLRKRHGDDLIVTVSDTVKHRRPNGIVLILEQLGKVFPLFCVKAVQVSHIQFSRITKRLLNGVRN